MTLGTAVADIVDLFYPELCPACNRTIMKFEDRLCMDCLFELPFTDMHNIEDNMIEQRLWGKLDFEAATAMLYFKKGGRVQNALHQLKYHGHLDIGRKLGEMLADELLKCSRFDDVDVVVPVPLHPEKLSSRGYNQCDLIAEGMENKGYMVCLDALSRSLHNPSQTRKGIYKRWENVSGIFSLHNAAELKNKHVLLIDDVITSGATLEACAKALKRIPGIRVSIAAVACAE